MPRPLQFVIFFAIAISLVFGLHYYLWLRLVRDAALTGFWARAVTVILAVAPEYKAPGATCDQGGA